MTETTVTVTDSATVQKIFGPSDEYLRIIRRTLKIQVILDDHLLRIRGEDSEMVRKGGLLFEHLLGKISKSREILPDDIQCALSELLASDEVMVVKPLDVYGAKRVRPKTAGQAKYIDLLRKKEIVICTGPAGTGKTFLAVARGVEALKNEGIKKIVLVRPAVEAGENLGFLPGDLNAKINPYLRPLFDALTEMIDRDMLRRCMEDDRVEVIPLAYMRGRTLNNAYMILDEAQNTTIAQMKMFLTRMGTESRIIVCGDVTQVDLPSHKKSGLTDALFRLKRINGIGTIRMNTLDIVRHNLVQQIVNAYEQAGHVVYDPQRDLNEE
ncbi:MAG: PhoH family protein [Planctomycetaceae bacterium]|jgi:phosphate starvation-inducible PhoH-like protein|nr:PhoH family protein [Planctomycetaceae bacterium]